MLPYSYIWLLFNLLSSVTSISYNLIAYLSVWITNEEMYEEIDGETYQEIYEEMYGEIIWKKWMNKCKNNCMNKCMKQYKKKYMKKHTKNYMKKNLFGVISSDFFKIGAGTK